MKILERYFIRSILSLSILFTIIIVTLYLIIDLFNNMTYYIDKKAVVKDLFLYYLYQAPALIITFFALGLLTAVFFSLAHRVRYNEVSAIRSMGIRMNKITSKILLIGFISAFILVFMNIFFVPYFNNLSFNIKRIKIEKMPIEKRYQRDIYFIGNDKTIYTAKYLDKKQNKMFNITIIRKDANGNISERYDSEYSLWKNNHWALFNVIIRNFDTSNCLVKYREIDIIDDYKLNIHPDKLIRGVKPIDNMTLKDLFSYASYMKGIGQDTKEIYTQIYYLFFNPLSVVVLVMLGVFIGINLKNTSNLFEFGISLLVGFFYWGTIQSFRALGNSGGISPIIAGLMPHIIFLIISILTIIGVKSYSQSR